MNNHNVRISYRIDEPDWDTFVAKVPGGNLLQTSLWGQVKAFYGWSYSRAIVSEGENIVAGVQLLIKSLPLIGSIAFIPKGPLFNSNDPSLRDHITAALFSLIKKHRILFVVIQPSVEDPELSHCLLQKGFQQSKKSLAPTATVILDLTIEPDQILAHMRKKTRQHIHAGQRKGLEVREGTESDLNNFFSLLDTSGKRLKFEPESEEYFRVMWRILNPHGYIKLFVAELNGEAISALLATPFNKTITLKRIGWSGDHSKLYPNELVHWEAIMWAKSHGYNYIDFEGIDRKDAERLIQGEHQQDAIKNKVTFFKIGFGGSVTLLPPVYEYIPNPALRYAYTKIFPKITSSPTLSHAYKFTRNLFTRRATKGTKS